MLRWRLTLGTLAAVGLVGLCWLDAQANRPGAFLALLTIVVCVLASGELLRIFRADGRSPSALAAYLGPAIVVASCCAPIVVATPIMYSTRGQLACLAVGMLTAMGVVFVIEMIRYSQPGESAVNLALGCLAALYVGGLLGALMHLRLLSVNGAAPSLLPLGSMIALVKFSDTCQYFVGKSLGRHKLAPQLSPGKTWEGAIGGICLTMIAGALAALLVSPDDAPGIRFSATSGAIFAFCVAVSGLAGDLAESLLKRDAGIKDSSAWLPGFGGVLDMIDSLLFAAPVAILFFAVL